MTYPFDTFIRPVFRSVHPELSPPSEDTLLSFKKSTSVDVFWANRFTPIRLFIYKPASRIMSGCFYSNINMLDGANKLATLCRRWNHSSYYWEPCFENFQAVNDTSENKPLARPFNSLQYVTEIVTYHKKGSAAFFMPTLSEIHAQTPFYFSKNRCFYFTTQPWTDSKDKLLTVEKNNTVYHIASTAFFKDKPLRDPTLYMSIK